MLPRQRARTATTLAATLATTLALAVLAVAPASAATGDSPSPSTPQARPVIVVPLCVTTTWRHLHTGQPKTKPGQTCRLTPGMWLPRSWVVLEHHGRTLIVARPA